MGTRTFDAAPYTTERGCDASASVSKRETHASPRMCNGHGDVIFITGSDFKSRFKMQIYTNTLLAILGNISAIDVVKVGGSVRVSVEYNVFCGWQVEGVNTCFATTAIQSDWDFVEYHPQNVEN